MSEAQSSPSNFLDFSGKTALVTGVLDEHSIAWPVAKYLNDGGARVALSIQRRAIRRLMGNILEQLHNPLVVECDVGEDEAITRMCGEVGAALGRIDY